MKTRVSNSQSICFWNGFLVVVGGQKAKFLVISFNSICCYGKQLHQQSGGLNE